jgi:hypothetical protein
MLNDALNLAKRDDGEKVGLSVQIQKSLKDDFEELCKANNVSMASMLQAMIKISVMQYRGEQISDMYNDVDYAYKKELLSLLLDSYVEAYANWNDSMQNGNSDEFQSEQFKKFNQIQQKIYKLAGIR